MVGGGASLGIGPGAPGFPGPGLADAGYALPPRQLPRLPAIKARCDRHRLRLQAAIAGPLTAARALVRSRAGRASQGRRAAFALLSSPTQCLA